MILYNCDKCGKDIRLNEPYISINYNNEVRSHDIAKQQDIIHVKRSVMINVLCGKCGNQNAAHSIAANLKVVKYGFIAIESAQEENAERLQSQIKPSKS